jgi:hypothetical protein
MHRLRFSGILTHRVGALLALPLAFSACASDSGSPPSQNQEVTSTPTDMPAPTQPGMTTADTSVPAPSTTDGTLPPPAATGDGPAPVASPGGVVSEDCEVFVDPGENPPPAGGFLPSEKVDMLFVIDNSSSMGDKQAVFRTAVPDMIDQMVNPPCVIKDEESMKEVLVEKMADGTCPADAHPIFKPVTDIHIGVVSSSLGPRGLTVEEAPSGFNCTDNPGQNDKAWMIGRARAELNPGTYQGYGFLVWDQALKAVPPGDNDLATLKSKFDAQIAGVGESGCGYEAPLEAAYRFLIEPDPYKDVVRGPCKGQDSGTLCAIPDGMDDDLLAQRAAFLRPDSVVVVLYLTDENDCSIKTRGQGYLAMATGQLDNGTLACETDPNGDCCVPCGVTTDPTLGCADATTNGCDRAVIDIPEAANVRCFEQQKRFGVSLLRSTDVYVGGFVFPKVQDRNGVAQNNPLFTDKRGRDKIFVVGIVGVPWQDTATAETLTTSEKGQLDLIESSKVDWGKYVSTAAGVPPTDPFNVESLLPRSGTHPLTGEAMGPAGTWNAISGHERALAPSDTFDDDLQYACIFPLPEGGRDCSTVTDGSYCDCAEPKADEIGVLGPEGNPLCFDGEAYTTVQRYAKAYPGPRMLEVLHGVACPPDPMTKMPGDCTDQAVVSSICPRQVTDPTKLDYAYRPVIRALLLNVSTRLVR